MSPKPGRTARLADWAICLRKARPSAPVAAPATGAGADPGDRNLAVGIVLSDDAQMTKALGGEGLLSAQGEGSRPRARDARAITKLGLDTLYVLAQAVAAARLT